MATLVFQAPATCFGTFDHDYIATMADKKGKDSSSFFKGEFSFVNKDAQNIDSKDHNAAVSWHVMNRYERFKKQEQAKQLRASANVPLGPLSPPSTTSRPNNPGSSKRQRFTPNQSPTTSIAASFDLDPWVTDPALQPTYSGASQNIASGAAAISATSTPSTMSSMLEDPFAALGPVELDMSGTEQLDLDPASTTLVSTILTFAYERHIPQNWPREVCTKQNGGYELARSWDDAAAMTQDQCYSNAYLALLAVAMSDTLDDVNYLQHAKLFQSQSMTELRRRLGSKGLQELSTLKAILKLFSAETIVDNTSVARVHLKMLRNVVTTTGGVILLDSWFREDLLSCDCYFALKYGTRPLFPASEWTPGPLSQPWKARLIAAGIQGDHAAVIDNSIEHPTLKAVVADLRELFRAYEYTQTHDVPTDDQLLRWHQLRKFDCISRLADHYINLNIYPHLYDKPATQAYTTLAIALLTNMLLGSPEPCRYGVKLLHDLKTKLVDNQAESEGKDDLRLRLWAAYIGSLGERVHVLESKTWFRDHMRTAGAKLNVDGWEEAEGVFKLFLYSKRLHEEIKTGPGYRKRDFRKGLYGVCGTSWRMPVGEGGETEGDGETGLVGAMGQESESEIVKGKMRAVD